MIGLDTNVLARYLAQDDAKQAALSTRLIEEELTLTQQGFISLVVVAELCWVLSSLYGATIDELVATLEDFLNTPQFCMEKREVLQAAIGRIKSKVAASNRKVGLPDALIAEIAASAGCTATMTFDKTAVRVADMTLLA